MTPPAAATVAGRRRAGTRPAATGRGAGKASGSARAAASQRPATSAPRRAAGGAGRAAGRRLAARRPPRRVAGPARPAAAARTAVAAGVAAARTAVATAAVALPERAPRPAARPRPRPVPRPADRRDLPLGARTLAWLRALPDHRLLDRLIGGRVWIVLIGGLLAGIVTMQLALLRLNAGIGAAVERSAELERRNAELSLAVSQLSDSRRIVERATSMGLVVPPQGSHRFLRARDGDAARALTTMRVPQAATAAAATPPAANPAAPAADSTTAAGVAAATGDGG